MKIDKHQCQKPDDHVCAHARKRGIITLCYGESKNCSFKGINKLGKMEPEDFLLP